MNKIDTKKIVNAFGSRIDVKRAAFDRLAAHATGSATEVQDLNFLCESLLSAIYVEFECLVSDLFHGYINNSNKAYLSNLESKIKSSVKDKYSQWHASHVTFSGPKHIASAQLKALMDPTNWNVTFKDVEAMKTRAGEWLSPPHAKKFSSLSPSDCALIDAAHAIRNCLAHNSESSRKVMNDKVRSIVTDAACTNVGLGISTNNVSTVGKYLRAAPQGSMRVVVYADRIKAIGLAL
jgi:hypothetical protein